MVLPVPAEPETDATGASRNAELMSLVKVIDLNDVLFNYDFAGFDGDEIDELDLGMSDELFQETVRKRLVGSMVNNGNSQRADSLGDV